jgi:hypothetical protein
MYYTETKAAVSEVLNGDTNDLIENLQIEREKLR